jgi:hypothetical protein
VLRLKPAGTTTSRARPRGLPTLDKVVTEIICEAGAAGITEHLLVAEFGANVPHPERLRTVLTRLSIAGIATRTANVWRLAGIAPPQEAPASAIRHKPAATKAGAGSPLYRCEACAEDLPLTEFQRLRDGTHMARCRTCHGALVAEKLDVQIPTGPDRRCPGCGDMRPAEQFYLTSNTARCKSCCREYQRTYDARRRARKAELRARRLSRVDGRLPYPDETTRPQEVAT